MYVDYWVLIERSAVLLFKFISIPLHSIIDFFEQFLDLLAQPGVCVVQIRGLIVDHAQVFDSPVKCLRSKINQKNTSVGVPSFGYRLG